MVEVRLDLRPEMVHAALTSGGVGNDLSPHRHERNTETARHTTDTVRSDMKPLFLTRARCVISSQTAG
jgi:hypothetical protein